MVYRIRLLFWAAGGAASAVGLAAWFSSAVEALHHGRWGWFALFLIAAMLCANGALYALRRIVSGLRRR